MGKIKQVSRDKERKTRITPLPKKLEYTL